MSRWPEKESDLAAPVIEYLQDLRWDVYQEVTCGYADSIADIVAVQGRLVWVIELKRSLSMSVIAQAADWHHRAHYASVAVPRVKGVQKGRRFAETVLDWRGLGFFEVIAPYRPGCKYSQPARLADEWGLTRKGRLNRHAMADYLRDAICPEHKTFAAAGNSDGRRWTPFRRTCQAVQETVRATPGLNMKQLVEAVDHHYSNDKSARAHIADWIRAEVIDGVRLEKEGRCLRVYPIENGDEPIATD